MLGWGSVPECVWFSHLIKQIKGRRERNFLQMLRREQMGICLIFCFFVFLATGAPALSSPDHYISSLSNHRVKPQQYFEVSVLYRPIS